MKLVISASPHIDSSATTRKIMGDVLIALLPALIAAVIIFGWRALLVTACFSSGALKSSAISPPRSMICPPW